MPTCNISDSDVPHTRGAAGIGLVRTETAILYDQSDEEQTTRLRELLKSAEGVPVLLRTCDTRADDDAPWAGETQDRLRGNRLSSRRSGRCCAPPRTATCESCSR